VWGRLTLVALLLAIAPGAARRAPAADDDKVLQEKALKLNEVTGEDPVTGTILTLVEEKERASTKKLLAAALKMAKAAPKDKPVFNINATWILGRAAQVLKDSETAEYFLRQNAAQALKLYSTKKFVAAYGRLVDVLYENKRYTEVEKICREILELEGGDDINTFKVEALEMLAQSLAKQGKTDAALALLDNLIKSAGKVKDERSEILLSRLKGQVLREAGKFEEAAKLYESLIDRVAKLKGIKDKAKDQFAELIRYSLSGLYIDMKNVDKAAEHLKVLLAKDEKNPTYNNDLGFIWADNDKNLDEAEKLIRRAIEEDRKEKEKLKKKGEIEEVKDNAAYLDSLGWVLYKKKKYKEALPYFLDAVKDPEEGQHLEIYDHLAEVYVALGQTDKALETWKKGLTSKPVGKRDEQRKAEVEKKVKKLEKKD